MLPWHASLPACAQVALSEWPHVCMLGGGVGLAPTPPWAACIGSMKHLIIRAATSRQPLGAAHAPLGSTESPLPGPCSVHSPNAWSPPTPQVAAAAVLGRRRVALSARGAVGCAARPLVDHPRGAAAVQEVRAACGEVAGGKGGAHAGAGLHQHHLHAGGRAAMCQIRRINRSIDVTLQCVLAPCTSAS